MYFKLGKDTSIRQRSRQVKNRMWKHFTEILTKDDKADSL